MTIRDTTSSTRELGFRVDGVVTPSFKRDSTTGFATCRREAQVVAGLRSFLPNEHARPVVETILTKLSEMEAGLRASETFACCEVVGSSLFFVADGRGRVGVWMMDFGLTCAADVPGGRLRRDAPWERGNHEDGYLTGLVNLQRLWRRVLKEL